MPNDRAPEGLFNYVITVDSLESITNIDFLYQLNDTLENRIESTIDLTNWK